MLIFNRSYKDPLAHEMLTRTLLEVFPDAQPVFICIGSERHILDCFGPLCGTLLQSSLPELKVYGCLDQPIHAKNLSREMKAIRQRHPGMVEMAIDASVGEEDEIGCLQLRPGALKPGRALAKNLPAVGDFSLTGIVDSRSLGLSNSRENTRGFAHVYHMAQTIQAAVAKWYVAGFNDQ